MLDTLPPQPAEAAEIRAFCRSLSAKERRGFFEQVVREADEETAAAIFGGKSYLSGLTNEQVATWRQAWAAARYPTLAGEELERLNRATGEIDKAIGGLGEVLGWLPLHQQHAVELGLAEAEETKVISVFGDNPWLPGQLNRTRQSEITMKDPELAERMRREAEGLGNADDQAADDEQHEGEAEDAGDDGANAGEDADQGDGEAAA